jgi:DUF1680 family protein
LVQKNWKKGDKITMELNPEIEVKQTADNQYYLQRGCLVYALEIPCTAKNIKEWPVKGFYDSYYKAIPDFEYKLQIASGVANNAGFALKNAAIGENVWINSPCQLVGKMYSPDKKQLVNVTLVPFGSTILRQVTFKVQ